MTDQQPEPRGTHLGYGDGFAHAINALANTEEVHPSHLKGHHSFHFEEPEKELDQQIEDPRKPDEGRALTSAYAELSNWATIRKFPRMYVLGVLVGFAGMSVVYSPASDRADLSTGTPATLTRPQDPWSVTKVSPEHASVSADCSGFINRFGTVSNPATHKIAIDAKWVSAWSVGQKGCSLVTQAIAHFGVDRFGRKPCLGVFVIMGAAAVLIEMFANTPAQWMAGKAFCGIVDGMVASGPLTLMAEMTFPRMRGNVLCWFAVAFCLGGLFCNVGFQILQTVSFATWSLSVRASPDLQSSTPLLYRRLVYSEWIFVVLYGVIFIIAPESPCKLTPSLNSY